RFRAMSAIPAIPRDPVRFHLLPLPLTDAALPGNPPALHGSCAVAGGLGGVSADPSGSRRPHSADAGRGRELGRSAGRAARLWPGGPVAGAVCVLLEVRSGRRPRPFSAL